MNLYNNTYPAIINGTNLQIVEYPKILNPTGNAINFTLESKVLDDVATTGYYSFRVLTMPLSTDTITINGIEFTSAIYPSASQFFCRFSDTDPQFIASTSDVASSIANMINSNTQLNKLFYAISNNFDVEIKCLYSGSIGRLDVTIPPSRFQILSSVYSNPIDGVWGSSKNDYSVQVELWMNNLATFGYVPSDIPINLSNSNLITTYDFSFNRDNIYRFDLSSVLQSFSEIIDPVFLDRTDYDGVYRVDGIKAFGLKYYESYTLGSNKSKVRFPIGEWRYGWLWNSSFNEKLIDNIVPDDYIYTANNFATISFELFNQKSRGWDTTYIWINGSVYTLASASNSSEATIALGNLIETLNANETDYTWSMSSNFQFSGVANNVGTFYNFDNESGASSNSVTFNPSSFWNYNIINASDDSTCYMLTDYSYRILPRKAGLNETKYVIFNKVSNANPTLTIRHKRYLKNGTIIDWTVWGNSIITNGSGIYGANIQLGSLAVNEEADINDTEANTVTKIEIAFFVDNNIMTVPLVYYVETIEHYNDYTELMFTNNFGGVDRMWFRNVKSSWDTNRFTYTRGSNSNRYQFPRKRVETESLVKHSLITDGQDYKMVIYLNDSLNRTNKLFMKQSDGKFLPMLVNSSKIETDNTGELYVNSIEIEESDIFKIKE